ncbi:hypothetical protein [Georgenia deserti]|uniref:AIM24 family protein n=1 Tax=Georgenia deserti TaxID=2093781 RepID=A0ABW4L5X3_9MICO
MKPTAPWTDADTARLGACRAHVDLSAGRPITPFVDVMASFRPRHGADEQLLAAGPFELYNFQALGDGTYQRGGALAVGTGVLGAAALGATLAASAVGNHSRKKRAQADAVPRWVQIDGGRIVVSNFGFYLETGAGLLPWSLTDLDQIEMVGPGQLLMCGTSMQGTIRWILASDWAELLFVVWTHALAPRHPQLLGGGWLPPGWLDHVRSHGYGSALGPAPGLLEQ